MRLPLMLLILVLAHSVAIAWGQETVINLDFNGMLPKQTCASCDNPVVGWTKGFFASVIGQDLDELMDYFAPGGLYDYMSNEFPNARTSSTNATVIRESWEIFLDGFSFGAWTCNHWPIDSYSIFTKCDQPVTSRETGTFFDGFGWYVSTWNNGYITRLEASWNNLLQLLATGQSASP